MKKVEFKYVDAEEAVKGKYPKHEDWAGEGDDIYDEYRTGIYRFEDDKPVAFIGSDGGEPEDQSFSRDLDWVIKAIQEALHLGMEIGRRDK